MAVKRIAISESVAAKLKEMAANASGTVKVGFIDSDQAMIAYWNEFGHGGRFSSPPRPFFRTMVANESSRWPEMLGTQLKRMKMDGKLALAEVGSKIEGQLKRSIRNFDSPPLSPVTLRLRAKFGNQPQEIGLRDVYQAIKDVQNGEKIASGTQAKPLIWTGQMINATSWKVE